MARWGGTKAGAANLAPYTLTDDFITQPYDVKLWSQFTFGVGVHNPLGTGEYEFEIPDTGTGGAFLVSKNRYDFHGDRFTVRVADIIDPTTGFQVFPVRVGVDSANYFFSVISGGFIGRYYVVGNAFNNMNFTAYNPAVHVYFSLREDDGDLVYEYATTYGSWTTLDTVANPYGAGLDSVDFRTGVDAFMTLANPSMARISHVGWGQ